jgi:hypothetical protein
MHWAKRTTYKWLSAILGLFFLILGAWWVTQTGSTAYFAPQSFFLYGDLLYIIALVPVILAVTALVFLFGQARWKGWLVLIVALSLGVMDYWDGFFLGGMLLFAAAVLSKRPADV